MHIIYHCVGGCHSSATAAAIHLGLLPMDHIPSKYDLLNVPYFDTLKPTDMGKIFYRGTDSSGHFVYTLGRQYIPHVILPAIQDFWQIIGQSSNDLLLVNALPCVNLLMKIGGFSSRRMQWVSFGRPIVTMGTLRTYPNLVQLVKETKKMLS